MAIIKQISNQTQTVQTIDTSEDFFNIDKTPLSIEQLIDAFEDLIIRFDNDPNYYTKKDYYYLLKYLGEIIRQLKNRADAEDLSNLNALLQETISNLHKKQDKQSDNLETQAKTIEGAINELANKHYSNYIETDGQDEAYMSHAAYTSQIISKYGFKDGDWTIGKNSGTVWVYDNGKFNNFGLANKLTDFSNAINELNAWKGNSDSNIQSIKMDVETVTDRVTSNTEQISDLWDAIDNLPQGGSAPAYTEGSGIDIKDGEISAVTDYNINVTIPVGGFEKPQTIDAGTDITTILKQLLEVVVGVKAVNPSITLSGTNLNKEFGTLIEDQYLTGTLTQGYFQPADDRWDGANQPMNCSLNSAELSTGEFAEMVDTGESNKPNTECYWQISKHALTSPETYTIISNYVTPNTNVPKNSNNDELPEEKGFKGGSVSASGTVTFTPYYNAFIGGIDVKSIDELTSDKIRSIKNDDYHLDVNPSSKTFLSGKVTSNNGKPVLIACPSCYKLVSIHNSLGQPDFDSYDQQKTVKVKCGEKEVEYTCYMNVVFDECKFQTVEFGRA